MYREEQDCMVMIGAGRVIIRVIRVIRIIIRATLTGLSGLLGG